MNRKNANMKKLLVCFALLLMSLSSAHSQVAGPVLNDEVTGKSVGFQVENNQLFLNYVNDGRDWFAISKPGREVPNLDKHFYGLFNGARYVEVVTTNGTETRYAVGVEKTVMNGLVPFTNKKYSVTVQLLTPGFGGQSFDALSWSRNGQVGLRLGLGF